MKTKGQARREKEQEIEKNKFKDFDNYISNKENIMPATTTTIDSPKYPGSKKIVIGLAQNLVLNSINDHNNL